MQSQGDVSDPADTAQVQSLRVLLGNGDAQPVQGGFAYEGRTYRGSFSRTSDGRIVNTVALEEYLYSVVPREMPPSWPAASLQAQAILARTFVLQRSAPQSEYDLIPSEADQVYTGIDSEHPQSTAAVDATAGMALRYANRFAKAVYSSCCGGHTAPSSGAWGSDVPYLEGITCAYCTAAPWYSWTKSLDLATVQNTLGTGDVQQITLDQTDASGRSRFWVFSGPANSTRLRAADVRTKLGTRVLPSLLVRRVDVRTQAPATLLIEGGGLGHGVGLCQWGARGMALQGSGASSILAYYFPGTGMGNV